MKDRKTKGRVRSTTDKADRWKLQVFQSIFDQNDITSRTYKILALIWVRWVKVWVGIKEFGANLSSVSAVFGFFCTTATVTAHTRSHASLRGLQGLAV